MFGDFLNQPAKFSSPKLMDWSGNVVGEMATATAAGSLAGRLSPVVGTAIAAIGICLEFEGCASLLPGHDVTPPDVPGWSDPKTPPATTPASTSSYQTCNGAGQQCVTDPNPQASCDGSWQLAGAYHGVYSTGTTCTGYRNSDGAYMGVRSTVPLDFTCPTGYQLSGSTCSLIPGQEQYVKWPADGKPTFMLDANGNWVPHPNDPDTLNAQGLPFTPPDQWHTQYPHQQDQYSNPTQTHVEPQPNGGMKLQQKTQGVDPQTGTTATTTHETTFNSGGQVINYTYQYNGNTSISSSSGSNLQLPTDYAREATLQGTNTKLQSILDEIKKPPESPPGIPDHEEGPQSETIPFPTISESGPELGSGCPPDISFAAMGTVITVPVGPMCEGANYVGPLIVAFAWLLAAKIVAGGLPLE